MHKLLFVNECQKCGLDIDEKLLHQAEWQQHLPEEFHCFDVLIIDSLLHPSSDSGLQRKAAILARMLDKSLVKLYEDTEQDIRKENAERRMQLSEKPDLRTVQRLIVHNEREEWLRGAIAANWSKTWGKLVLSQEELWDIWHVLRKKIRQHDGYWKSRWMLQGQLSSNDLCTLKANATGSMRYAHILYQVGTYIGQYISFITEKPAPSLIVEGGAADIREYSLCPFCGEKMKDIGMRKRQHCGAESCKREYDRTRKKAQRQLVRAKHK